MQSERDELYAKFVKAIHEVQQKSSFKNLLLEKKLGALSDTLEKKEAQLNEVLSASNLDPTALTVVTRKLEVCFVLNYGDDDDCEIDSDVHDHDDVADNFYDGGDDVDDSRDDSRDDDKDDIRIVVVTVIVTIKVM